MQLVEKREQLQGNAEKMNDYWATQEEVAEAAISTFTNLYGGKNTTLTKIRYVMICMYDIFSIN